MSKIRVVIVDDHPLVLDGLRDRLNRSDDIEVVGEANDGAKALDIVRERIPDVVLMDINMPKLNGIQSTQAILDLHPNTIILVLSMHDDKEYVTSAIESGARGYVLKSASAEEMFNAIKAVSGGGVYYSPVVAELLRNKSVSSADTLTEREQVILDMLARGFNNKQSAAALGISARTVETHRRNIKKKLGLRSTPALIRYAIDSGLGKETDI